MIIDTPEQLYSLHRKAFLTVALKYLPRPEDAEDCVQDAMLRIVRFWASCDKSKALAWGSRIVRNAALDVHRKRKSHGNYHLHIPLDLIEEPVDMRYTARNIEARLLLEAGMARMSPALRATLLRSPDSRSRKSTARVQLLRARRQFCQIVA